ARPRFLLRYFPLQRQCRMRACLISLTPWAPSPALRAPLSRKRERGWGRGTVLAKTANVIHIVYCVYLEAAIRCDFETGSCSISFERGFSGDFYLAFAGGDLHQFRCAHVK